MILYVIFWSDNFKGAMLRKNKNSAWIKTITICPSQDQITSFKYTHAIALGRKGSYYDEINITHNIELQQLSQCMYCCFGTSHVC